MGYTTDFEGSFRVTPVLDEETIVKLKEWSKEDHREGGAPGIWCQWIPTDNGTAIEWDGNEKFYDYIPWLRYIIKHFLEPKGYTLNGDVYWVGEDSCDQGKITVIDNVVLAAKAEYIYPDPICFYGSKEKLQNLCKSRPELRDMLSSAMVEATMEKGDEQ